MATNYQALLRRIVEGDIPREQRRFGEPTITGRPPSFPGQGQSPGFIPSMLIPNAFSQGSALASEVIQPPVERIDEDSGDPAGDFGFDDPIDGSQDFDPNAPGVGTDVPGGKFGQPFDDIGTFGQTGGFGKVSTGLMAANALGVLGALGPVGAIAGLGFNVADALASNPQSKGTLGNIADFAGFSRGEFGLNAFDQMNPFDDRQALSAFDFNNFEDITGAQLGIGYSPQDFAAIGPSFATQDIDDASDAAIDNAPAPSNTHGPQDLGEIGGFSATSVGLDEFGEQGGAHSNTASGATSSGGVGGQGVSSDTESDSTGGDDAGECYVSTALADTGAWSMSEKRKAVMWCRRTHHDGSRRGKVWVDGYHKWGLACAKLARKNKYFRKLLKAGSTSFLGYATGGRKTVMGFFWYWVWATPLSYIIGFLRK